MLIELLVIVPVAQKLRRPHVQRLAPFTADCLFLEMAGAEGLYKMDKIE